MSIDNENNVINKNAIFFLLYCYLIHSKLDIFNFFNNLYTFPFKITINIFFLNASILLWFVDVQDTLVIWFYPKGRYIQSKYCFKHKFFNTLTEVKLSSAPLEQCTLHTFRQKTNNYLIAWMDNECNTLKNIFTSNKL